MTPDNLLHELENLISLLLDAELALSATKVVSVRGHGGFERITWATNSQVPGRLFRTPSATVAEYRNWIKWHGYSAILFDGSLLQISYDFENSELIAHRLSYFPCPFDLEVDLLGAFGLIEVVDMYQTQEVPHIRLRAPVRFDYSKVGDSLTHPKSHMTFQWSHTRIPVIAPISLGHFIRFIFKSFYPFMWEVHEFVREWPLRFLNSTISPDEEALLHFSFSGLLEKN